ncbi:HAD hydrolase-like protein [Limibaculum sp. M0105]|uniref:HAD hydrolase-like protein n=1 Tax=Thermohalobaculum xanthum TaxID=2753746 RepID=A0A8J7M4Q8_9RHOB|nr:HAD hydrolase-like protein [Thermohalobaculum xanthum]MBK0398168.1 HAD hydrolase-like protein [Thermohalobaculum xanthum]
MDDVTSIFGRYEEIRHRLPEVHLASDTRDVGSLLEIADEADAFVFDAFGVLNVGDTPIAGAASRLDELRAKGCSIRILTNAASFGRALTEVKFRKLGIAVPADEIVTSRDAALAHVTGGLWGCIAAPSDDLSDVPSASCRLADDSADYDRCDGILFLSTATWTPARQAILERTLLDRPRPLLIANADLVAPRGDRFSLEPGHFGHLLADRGVGSVHFFGKPFPEVYRMVETSLPGVPRERIVMCGDTLHTDIIGAAARGWKTAFITRDGLFSGVDTRAFIQQSSLFPTWRMPRI